MKITKDMQGTVAVLTIRDGIIADDLAKLDEAVSDCIESGQVRVVLDIAQVPVIDSAGLEKLQSTVTDLGRRHGDLRIAAPNDVCRDILIATRLDSFVQVSTDLDEAVQSLL